MGIERGPWGGDAAPSGRTEGHRAGQKSSERMKDDMRGRALGFLMMQRAVEPERWFTSHEIAKSIGTDRRTTQMNSLAGILSTLVEAGSLEQKDGPGVLKLFRAKVEEEGPAVGTAG